jgi:hypothetical protein
MATPGVDVRILTQLPEPSSVLPFNNLSQSTTVGQLKVLIQTTLPAAPSSEAQRLIYRGRVLIREEDTLLDILGRDTIELHEPQSIHLVIRDARLNVPPQAANGIGVLQNPPAPTAQPGVPRLLNATLAPRDAQGLPLIHGPGAGQQLQDPNMNNMMQAMIEQNQRRAQAVMAQAQQRAGMLHAQARFQPQVGPQATSPNGGTNTMPANAQEILVGGHRHDPIANNPAQPNMTAPFPGLHGQIPVQHTHGQGPIPRSAIGLQGQRWTITVNGVTTTNQSGFPNMMPPMLPQMTFNPFGGPVGPMQNVDPSVFQLQNHMLTQNVSLQTARELHDNLDNLVQSLRIDPIVHDGVTRNHALPRASTARGLLHEHIDARNNLQEQVNNIMAHGPQGNQMPINASDVAEFQRLNEMYRALVREAVEVIDAMPGTPQQAESSSIIDPLASSSGTAAAGQSTPATSTGNVSAYMLNSPSGPHAIVYSPHGTFASIQQPVASPPGAPFISHASFQDAFRSLRYGSRNNNRPPSQNSPHNVDTQTELPAQNAQPPDPGPAAQQQLVLQQPFEPQAAQPAAPAAPQAAENGIDLGLAPFFRALWLFVRAYGIFWLFLGGNGNSVRRTVLLVVMTIMYWGYQAGLFRDQITYLQGHWDGLIRIPENVIAQQARPANLRATDNERLAQGTFTPEEAAQRLLEARQRGEGGIRARLRTIERALVLFAISFWPGGGERLVAERERQRREADEQRARAVEEALERDRTAVAAATESVARSELTAEANDALAQTEVVPKDEPEPADRVAENAGEGSSSGIEVGAAGDNQLTARKVTEPIREQ